MPDKKTASFMRSLCLGEIEEEILLPFPEPGAEERQTLGAVSARLKTLLGGREEDFQAWDRAGAFPPSFIDELRQAGLFGLVIPEVHGGMGLGAAAYSRVVQELARQDAATAVTVGAHSSIGMRGLLLFGTEEQRGRFLPRLASGELVAAFCLTEPGAGSDAAGIRATAVRDGGDWILNGEKIWIVNGGFAGLFTVFAKTSLEGRGHITAFLVTRDMKGVSIGPPHDKLGIRAASTCSVSFEDVRIPAANVLGEVGKGFKVAMKILNAGRTGLGGGAVGGMKRLIDLAARHARERSQFGRPIGTFESIRQKLGQMVLDCYVAESVVNLVAGLADRGYEELAVEAAISKVLASEALWRTADEALQIAGGAGYMKELPYERALRDARIHRIFEGTNDILRLFVALAAVNDVADTLKDLPQSMKGVLADPVKGFGLLSEYAKRRASLAARLPREKGKYTLLTGPVEPQARQFEEHARALAVAADRMLRRHGPRIVEAQLAGRALAEAMIDVFALAAVLARVSTRVEDHGETAAAPELELLRAFAAQARRRVRRNLAAVDAPDEAGTLAIGDRVIEAGGYRY